MICFDGMDALAAVRYWRESPRCRLERLRGMSVHYVDELMRLVIRAPMAMREEVRQELGVPAPSSTRMSKDRVVHAIRKRLLNIDDLPMGESCTTSEAL